MKKRFFIMLVLCMMVPCIPINAGTGTKYDKEYTIEKGNMRFEGSILDKKKSYKIVTENKKIVSATKSSENVIIKGKKKGITYITIYVKRQGKYKKYNTIKVTVKNKIPMKRQYKYIICNENGDEYVSLVKYKCDNSKVNIPEFIEGKVVKKIEKNCFRILDEKTKVNQYITSVNIGNGVEIIGKSAFGKLHQLKEVTLPNGLRKMEDSVFIEDSNLKKVNNIEFIYNLGYVPLYTFWRCSSFSQSIIIPSYVKEIEDGAFCGTGVSNLEIKEGTEKIGSHAFAQMKLNVVVLPKSVKEIGSVAFAGNPIDTVVIKSKDTKYDDMTFRSTKIGLPNIYEIWKIPTD